MTKSSQSPDTVPDDDAAAPTAVEAGPSAEPAIPDALGEFTASFWAERRQASKEAESASAEAKASATRGTVATPAETTTDPADKTPPSASTATPDDAGDAPDDTSSPTPDDATSDDSSPAPADDSSSAAADATPDDGAGTPATSPTGPIVVLPEDEGIVLPPPRLYAERAAGRIVEPPVLRVEDNLESERASQTDASPSTPASPAALTTRLRARLAPARPTASLSVVERLRDGPPTDRRNRVIGWLVAAGLVLLAFGLRVIDLGQPPNIMFDETYYAKDAWSLLQAGYEQNWVQGADQIIANGDYSVAQDKEPDYVKRFCPRGVETCTWNGLKPGEAENVVHPMLGKWLIAAGEAVFGLTPFGWRISACVFGSLLVGAVVRLARRLSHSNLIGGLAGLLVCFDGLSFVMSRIALLDIFQATLLVLGVGAVVADRDYFRARLADRIEARGGRDLEGAAGGFVFRPWLLVAGVMFGLSCGVKWNSMYAVAVFGVLTVVWSVSARRLAGARGQRWKALWLDGLPAFFSLVALGVATYIATWASWFATSGGRFRDWGANNPDAISVRLFGRALGSLWHYTVDVYNFHTGEYINTVPAHVYASKAIGWLVLARPICFSASGDIKPGTKGCPDGTENCLSTVYANGTPLLWWLAAAALVIAAVWWLAGADWRFGVTTLAVASTWVPWSLETSGRSLFFFYAITIIPFTAIGLAMVLGVILGPSNGGKRRSRGAIIVGATVALIILNFAFMYPVYADGLLLHSRWQWRMWFSRWI